MTYSGSGRLDELAGSTQHDPTRPDTGIGFRLLGPLEARRDGVDRAPSTPKILQLLALLVLRPGRIVHTDTIIRELWANDPPRSVRTTLHTYVYHLRRSIDRHGPNAGYESLLETKSPGYVFHIDARQVDVHAFGLLQQQGRELGSRHRYAEAAQVYRAALDLWSGPPLANVHCGPVLSAHKVELLEQKRSTLHLRIEAEINSGRHLELIGELRSLVVENPLDESLHGQLMLVLGRSGRRSDAMATYRSLRARLTGELGLEPCDELQLLHRKLLSEGEPAA